MRLISWNVNGYRSIFQKGLLQFIASEQPDVLCLQETKANPEQLNAEQLKPLNYTGYFSSATKKGYSGVASFFKHNDSEIKVTNQIGQDRYDSEGRFIISKFADITLYNIYFPSGTTGDIRQDFKYDFLAALYEHLLGLPKTELEKVILCGDFNICHRAIDIHHPEQATKLELSGFLPKERAWLDKLAELNFIDTFRHTKGDVQQRYSWWTYRAGARGKNLGWRIDYFWVHSALANRIVNADILSDVTGSDHAPVLLELK